MTTNGDSEMSGGLKVAALGAGMIVFCLAMLIGVGCSVGWQSEVPRWLFECLFGSAIVMFSGIASSVLDPSP